MDSVAVNARFLDQPITGVQRYGIESSAAMRRLLGDDRVLMLRPPDGGPVLQRLWELGRLAQDARRVTGSPATLNLCNWGPIRGAGAATVVLHDAAVHARPQGFSPAYRGLAKAWMRFLRTSSTNIVTVSKRSQAALERILARPVALAPCGVDIAAARAAVGRGTGVLANRDIGFDRFVLFVGAHDQRKNLAFALSVLPMLRARGIALVATYRAGGRSLTPPSSTGPDPGVGVALVADPTDEEMWELYDRALAVLHPSHYEGFGLPLLEAAAVGTPFLTAPVGAAEELAVDERQIVDLDEQRWVEALDGLLRDREPLSRQLMVRSAEYSWEATAQALLEATKS